MNFKTNIYLFVAIAVLIGVLVVAQFTGPKKGEEGKLLPGIEAKDVTRITIERKEPSETKLVFVRVDKDHWKLEEPYDAHVDGRPSRDDGHQPDVRQDGDQGRRPARATRRGTTWIAPRSPSRLQTGGKTVTANFGKVTIGPADSSLVYVNTADRKTPMAVKRSSLSGLVPRRAGRQIGRRPVQAGE